MEFLKSQFDKLLLSALIVLMIGVLIHMTHHEPDSAAVQWIEKSIDMAFGSLLTLVTGAVMSRRLTPPPVDPKA